VTLIDYEEIIKEGEKLSTPLEDVTSESVYTLSYTSGTTGMPKGTMLTHRNFLANVGGMDCFDGVFKFYPDDVYISYLPLAHVFERFLMLTCMCRVI
jgi:long-chain acyl-CoA synthetase